MRVREIEGQSEHELDIEEEEVIQGEQEVSLLYNPEGAKVFPLC